MSLHEVDGEWVEVTWRPRDTTLVPMNLPKTVMASLEQVAQSRDMSIDALLKLYIGRSLRQDLSDLRRRQPIDAGAERL
jgi:hypothetical protein